MDREIEKELAEWREQVGRMPLLIRGARQVGKTYVVEKFGRDNFEVVASVNFELDPSLCEAFENLEPQRIVARLEIALGVSIVSGKTLLFLDEIQVCPRAIMALRYFKERMPELHVIGAGSLLEFALEDEKFSFPVGRVQYLYMHPLSFMEFLRATGEEKLAEALGGSELDLFAKEGTVHQHALDLVRRYLLVGGMPAAVQAFKQTGSYRDVQRIQQGLLQTFRDDFGKYATKARHKYLQVLFAKVPLLVGSHFQYSKVDREMRTRDLKVALEQLGHAGLISRIHATAANGIPLRAEINDRKFKLLFLDVGLVQRAHNVEPSAILEGDILQVNSGQLAEQFVGQELLAYSDPYEERGLYFWERATRGSSAEIDYVTRVDSHIVPIEVKAGKTGRLRSLRRFIELKGVPLGVRVSHHHLERDGQILSIPLYMLSQLNRLASR